MLIGDEKTSSLKHRKQIMVNHQISKNLLQHLWFCYYYRFNYMFYDWSFCAIKLFVNLIAMSNVNYFIKYDMNYRLIGVLSHLLGQDVDNDCSKSSWSFLLVEHISVI